MPGPFQPPFATPRAAARSEGSGGASSGGRGTETASGGPRGPERTLLVVTSRLDGPSREALERLAESGERPRREYVEVAKLLDAEIIDGPYMATRASPLARLVAERAGMPAGQVMEAFLRAHEYDHVCAWADRLGLPLALLFKLAGRSVDLVLVSVWLSSPQKAVFLKDLKVHTHLRAIINYGSVQAGIAATRLGVPPEKLHLALQPVDTEFWKPEEVPEENLICSVGWEHRDYPTLLEAVRGLDVRLELAVGTTSLFEPVFEGGKGGMPSNVVVHQKLEAPHLRQLYARSRFVVIPVENVEFDAGVTAMGEAMAMGKPIIVTKTRGQADVLEHGVQGLYVPPGDPAAMRAAIERLLGSPEEVERMGRAARELVMRRLTLDDYVRKVTDVITGASGPSRLPLPAGVPGPLPTRGGPLGELRGFLKRIAR